MSEGYAEQKREEQEGPVPECIFSEAWQKGNFIIPANKELRIELKQKLENYSHYEIMWRPENEETRRLLLARIAALDAYDHHEGTG